uniref:Uncharacterized protein n=1 Tax=Tanacetum cinerariifolium TaxID=118510 RepID=A0A6L2P153_TANCI|nr:hypothetical protein [Tanacetum cinerariifolium]
MNSAFDELNKNLNEICDGVSSGSGVEVVEWREEWGRAPWCRFVVGVSEEDDGSGVRGSGVEQEVGKMGYGGWRENRLGVNSAFKKRGKDGTIL